MIVHDIIGFESRSTVTSSNFLGTKTYGTIAVDSEFKSGMEDISSDVAKEFAQPFKKEVSLIHSFIHSFIQPFIHTCFIQSFIRSFVHSFIHLFSLHSSFLLLLLSLTFLNQQFIPISFYVYLPHIQAFVKLNFRK